MNWLMLIGGTKIPASVLFSEFHCSEVCLVVAETLQRGGDRCGGLATAEGKSLQRTTGRQNSKSSMFEGNNRYVDYNRNKQYEYRKIMAGYDKKGPNMVIVLRCQTGIRTPTENK
ncbi:hypothetical protein HAX54_041741 [Datura stramonium]|uniref:Uncharacterized protein n=1 Tax=Datura stramonium TaxID=4076 RepID=A0ABS8SLI1_DATST|nr:hypothetical protein [Datura stramonium]